MQTLLDLALFAAFFTYAAGVIIAGAAWQKRRNK